MQQRQAKEAWLVGEHRALGERKYYLSNLPPRKPNFASTAKHRASNCKPSNFDQTQGLAKPIWDSPINFSYYFFE